MNLIARPEKKDFDAILAKCKEATAEFAALFPASDEGTAPAVTPLFDALSEKGQQMIEAMMKIRGGCGGRPVTLLEMFAIVLDEDLIAALREVERVREGAPISYGPEIAVVPYAVVVPTANPNAHDYELNEPAILLDQDKAARYAFSEENDDDDGGNNITTQVKACRPATEEEIEAIVTLWCK